MSRRRLTEEEKKYNKKIRAREYYLKHREEINARSRNWNRQVYTPKWRRQKHLRYKFNLTLEQYDTLLHQQAGVCAICQQPEKTTQCGKTRPLHIDHNHITAEVRGLLCSSCNLALGLFSDNPTLLKAAIAYLKKHSI